MTRWLLKRMLGLAAAWAVGVPAGAQALREESITPSSTDPAITQWNAAHVVIVDEAVTPRGQILVYLHGLGGTGGGARELLRTAASAGFRAIGLTHASDWAPFTFCGSSGSDCYEHLRREIIDGVDRSPHIAVSAADSVTNRLARLLARLEALHPGEGWAGYLNDAATPAVPRWNRIVVWGHSQGGANASMLARHEVLAGVCLSAQATDFVGSAPAAWWSTHATPSARYYGFCHAQDQLSAKVAVWARQGLDAFGAVRDIAQDAPPYGGTHQFSTTVAPAVAGQYHNSVVSDALTPRDAMGRPVYADVWRTMITGAAAAAGCAADFNGSGAATVQDVFDFLEAYFSGVPEADFNASGSLSVQDVFDFLAAYFAGCG